MKDVLRELNAGMAGALIIGAFLPGHLIWNCAFLVYGIYIIFELCFLNREKLSTPVWRLIINANFVIIGTFYSHGSYKIILFLIAGLSIAFAVFLLVHKWREDKFEKQYLEYKKQILIPGCSCGEYHE